LFLAYGVLTAVKHPFRFQFCCIERSATAVESPGYSVERFMRVRTLLLGVLICHFLCNCTHGALRDRTLLSSVLCAYNYIHFAQIQAIVALPLSQQFNATDSVSSLCFVMCDNNA